jgi:hypothetical protein
LTASQAVDFSPDLIDLREVLVIAECSSKWRRLVPPARSPSGMERKAWETEADKMRYVYKAPVVDEDVKAIVDYLARIKGGGLSISTPWCRRRS